METIPVFLSYNTCLLSSTFKESITFSDKTFLLVLASTFIMSFSINFSTCPPLSGRVSVKVISAFYSSITCLLSSYYHRHCLEGECEWRQTHLPQLQHLPVVLRCLEECEWRQSLPPSAPTSICLVQTYNIYFLPNFPTKTSISRRKRVGH